MFTVSLVSGMELTSVVVMVTREEQMVLQPMGAQQLSQPDPWSERSITQTESAPSPLPFCAMQKETPALTSAKVYKIVNLQGPSSYLTTALQTHSPPQCGIQYSSPSLDLSCCQHMNTLPAPTPTPTLLLLSLAEPPFLNLKVYFSLHNTQHKCF